MMKLKFILSNEKSVFLDILRISAAFWVMSMHTFAICFPFRSKEAYQHGHAAVIIFFVLSGYVIAYTTKKNNRGLGQYTIARLVRLYSILIPSILLCIVIEVVLKLYYYESYLSIQRGNSLFRYLSSLIFANEIWFFSSAPPLNAPLWSLSYEFSYYFIYGIIFFRNQLKYKYTSIIFSFILVGPKVLLLMPIWLMGVMILYLPKININYSMSKLLSLLSILGGLLIIFNFPSYPFTLGVAPLYFASGFLLDWLIGFFFSLSLWLYPNIENINADNKSKRHNIIRLFSNLTFPVYLIHNPLLILLTTIFKCQINHAVYFGIILLFITILSFSIGIIFEKFRNITNSIINIYINDFINRFRLK